MFQWEKSLPWLRTLTKVWKRHPDPAFRSWQSRIPNFRQDYPEYPSLSTIPRLVPKIWRNPLPNFLSNPVYRRKFAFSRISHCIWSYPGYQEYSPTLSSTNYLNKQNASLSEFFKWDFVTKSQSWTPLRPALAVAFRKAFSSHGSS